MSKPLMPSMITPALIVITNLLRGGSTLLAAVLAFAAAPAQAAEPPDAKGLRLGSVHAAVADLDSGELVYEKNAGRAVPIASITKLMTALVVLESDASLDEWLTIVEREEPPPVNSFSRMRPGSQLRRRDLLRAMLMASDNLAAYVLSRHHPGGPEAFIEAMNRRARELEMQDTQFVGPSGLSDDNRSSARDLLKLVTAAIEHESIRDYSQTRTYTATFRKPRYRLRFGNTNYLVHHGGWDVRLGKTGYLRAAGRCLVLVAEFDDRRVAMALLDSFGSRTPVGDAGRVRDWLATGSGGRVAAAARRYERRRTASYAKAEQPADAAEAGAVPGGGTAVAERAPE